MQPLPSVRLVALSPHADARGSFVETWNRRMLAELGIHAEFVQDNESRSARWVLRGLHYQQPHAQGKLVRVVTGAIFDVAVDLRRDAPGFGRWVANRLTGGEPTALWIPPGFAHGFLSLTEGSIVQYKADAPFEPSSERVIAWDDPDLGIDWPLPEGVRPILSDRDAAAGRLRDAAVRA